MAAAEAAAPHRGCPTSTAPTCRWSPSTRPSSRDLDQALHIERDGDGYLVHYAIADVAAFVAPGDPVDVEAHRRGETLYGADSKVPLHPTSLISEGAAWLLPDQVRPALLWTIKVDATGEGTDVDVERAGCAPRPSSTTTASQQAIDDGTADRVADAAQGGRRAAAGPRGRARRRVPAAARAGGRGRGRPLEPGVPRRSSPVEQWNAQISLLTGMAAASLMVYGAGRPAPHPAAARPARRPAAAPHRAGAGHRVARRAALPRLRPLPGPEQPTHAAMVIACTRLLRGSGYVAFDGEVPDTASTLRWRPSTPT